MAQPRLIPIGKNNPLLANVSFEIGQADFKVAYVRLSDATTLRYSPPVNAVKQPNA